MYEQFPYLLQPTKRVGVIACDTFSRANTTTLGSTNNLPYLPGRPGVAWTEHAGNWEINANRIGSEGSSPGGNGWLVSCDPGVADIVLEVTLASAPTAASNGILVRMVDDANWIRLRHTNVPLLVFEKCVAGTVTTVDSGASSAPVMQAGDTIVISAIGTALTARVIRAGAQVGNAATATDDDNPTATRVGFRAAAASVYWTNLVVRRAA